MPEHPAIQHDRDRAATALRGAIEHPHDEGWVEDAVRRIEELVRNAIRLEDRPEPEAPEGERLEPDYGEAMRRGLAAPAPEASEGYVEDLRKPAPPEQTEGGCEHCAKIDKYVEENPPEGGTFGSFREAREETGHWPACPTRKQTEGEEKYNDALFLRDLAQLIEHPIGEKGLQLTHKAAKAFRRIAARLSPAPTASPGRIDGNGRDLLRTYLRDWPRSGSGWTPEDEANRIADQLEEHIEAEPVRRVSREKWEQLRRSIYTILQKRDTFDSDKMAQIMEDVRFTFGIEIEGEEGDHDGA